MKLLLLIILFLINNLLAMEIDSEDARSGAPNRIPCFIAAPTLQIAKQKFSTIQSLTSGQIGQAKKDLESFQKQIGTPSPKISRKIIGGTIMNIKSADEGLELLKKNGMSLATLDEATRDNILNCAFTDLEEYLQKTPTESIDDNEKTRLSQRFLVLLLNYADNEPNRTKATAIYEKYNKRYERVTGSIKKNNLDLDTVLRMPIENFLTERSLAQGSDCEMDHPPHELPTTPMAMTPYTLEAMLYAETNSD